MGKRFYNERYPKFGNEEVPHFTRFWWGSSYGKYIKKRLHKVERLAAKREIRGLHQRKSLVGARSEVDWKGW